MVDVSDRNSVNQGRDLIDMVMTNKELKDKPILVFGNMIDKQGSLSEEELREKLNI